MPSAFVTFQSLIAGYINGAGLGTLLIEWMTNSRQPETKVAALALLIVGPFGALLGLLTAQANKGKHETDAGSA